MPKAKKVRGARGRGAALPGGSSSPSMLTELAPSEAEERPRKESEKIWADLDPTSHRADHDHAGP